MKIQPLDPPPEISFSKRQLEVISAWGECPTPGELALRLEVSVHTVQTHLKRMRQKLGVRRTVEVLLYLKRCNGEAETKH